MSTPGDVNDDFQRRAAGDFAPPLRQRAAFVEGERVRFSRGAADEGEGKVVLEQVCRLLFDDRKIERTILLERCMEGGNETVEWMDC